MKLSQWVLVNLNLKKYIWRIYSTIIGIFFKKKMSFFNLNNKKVIKFTLQIHFEKNQENNIFVPQCAKL